ncbi:MAG: DVUA0089 family protein [Proteobacteria bacterium]|nr:DVUA0089 family protein [Pseudomonadota bacterium]
MKKLLVFLCSLILVFGAAGTVSATYITEIESNSVFTSAQNVDSAFSLDSDADIFWSTTYYHASVRGTNAATSDVDYYTFTVGQAGVTGFFDIDYGRNAGISYDASMALFDSGYNTLAVNDDALLDPGSVHSYDSFIGVYTFANPGTYYLAVSNYANFPLVYGTSVGFMIRPDESWDGIYYAGDSGATAMDISSGYYSSGDYVLHLSLSDTAPVPEPATMLLLGTGLIGIAGFRRKFKK